MRKLFYIFTLICIAVIIFASGCSFSDTNDVSSRTGSEKTQDKLTLDGNKQNSGTNNVSSETGSEKTQEKSTLKDLSSEASSEKVQEKLTLDGIKKNCAKNNEEIISTKEYGDYVIVESQPKDSQVILTLYNLKTGDKDMLPDYGYRIDFEKIKMVDENHITLYTGGNDYYDGHQAFPLEIDCARGLENTGSDSDFVPIFKEMKFPIAEQNSIRGKFNVKEEILDIRDTVNGLQICFGPQNSDDVNFSAAYVDCPTVDISYDETSNEFTLNFKDTRIAKSYAEMVPQSYSNSYIESINLKESGDSAAVITKLKDSAKYYTGKKSEVAFDMLNSVGIPYMDIQFFNSNMEF